MPGKWMTPEEQKVARLRAQQDNNKRTASSYKLMSASPSPPPPVPVQKTPGVINVTKSKLKKPEGGFADVLDFDPSKRRKKQ